MESVKYDTIKILIIDNGQFLRKIITRDRTVVINTSKIKPKDASKLIHRLSLIAKKHNIETIDSWDVMAEKGYIKTLYWINNVVMILVGIIVIVFIAMRGFNSRHLPFIFFLFPQLYFMGRQMKQKIDRRNKRTTQNNKATAKIMYNIKKP